MQSNDLGQIAVRRLRQAPKVVRVGNNPYVFSIQNNVVLGWVNEEHLQQVLNIPHTCCGGSKKKQFILASETDVRRFYHGGR